MKLSIQLLLKTLQLLPRRVWRDDVILCYHDVNNDGWEFSVTKEQFHDHITILKRHFDIVSLSKILNHKNKSKKPRVSITFDDGYKGVIKQAYPVLKKEGCVATVFVIGSSSINPKGQLKSEFLSKSDIKKLKMSGWEIGFHTTKHADVSAIEHPKLKREIMDGKQNLEKKLGLNFNYFAYPSGKFSRKAIEMVRKSGFKVAFSVRGNKLTNDRTGYVVSRITVSKHLSDIALETLLTPTGILINLILTTLWRLKDNITKG